MRTTIFLTLSIFALWPAAAQDSTTDSYDILYTGRTLGYARVPDQQTLKPPLPGASNSPVAEDFLRQFNGKPPNKDRLQLRIGMGDNFSPDLFARTFSLANTAVLPCGGDAPFSHSMHLPKDMFNYKSTGAHSGYWELWCNKDATPRFSSEFYDNVAQFFVAARYNAIAPGKHDFYFGQQYLRQVAYLLRGKGVHMLADNLVMTASVAPGTYNTHPRIPERAESDCHNNTYTPTCFHTDFGPASLDLPDNVFPWKRQFVLRGARPTFIKEASGQTATQLFRSDELNGNQRTSYKDNAVDYDRLFDEDKTYVCAESGFVTSGDPTKVPLNFSQCMQMVASDKACVTPSSEMASTCNSLYGGPYEAAKNAASPDVTFLFLHPSDHLKPGLNHMFCTLPAEHAVRLFGSGDIPICQAFPVQVPLFWSDPNDPDPHVDSKACDEMIQCPYLLVNNGKQTVAVFAVLDPDLLSNVGMLNAT
jgi:hypothetical protein